MSTSIENLLRTDYMPHGVCYQWIPEVLWLNVLADLLIATSYFSIPIALYYFARKRTDLKFRGLFLLFSLFIALCGVTHLASIFVIWNGAYGFHGILKLLTAIVSCYAAYRVYSSIPTALQLPSAIQIKNTFEKSSKDAIDNIVREHENRQDHILRESTDSAHVGILVISGEGIISLANKSVCRIFGYQKDELENQNVDMLISPDFRENHASLMKKFIDSDEMIREMAMNRIVTGFHKSGNPVPLEIRLTRAEHDRETIYVSLQDVSERVRYEQKLAASVSVTNSVLAHIPMGVRLYEIDNDSLQFIQQNAAAEQILDTCTTDPFLHEPSLILKMIAAARSSSAAVKTDFVLPGQDKSSLQLYLFNTSPGKMALMFENITAQKQFEGRLIERESIIRRAINASIAGVYIFDVAERQNRFVNDRYSAITGYTLQDINALEEGISSIIHDDDLGKVMNHLHHLLNEAADDSVFTIQYRVRHANGSWLWLMVQDLVFERDQTGRPTQLIGSFLDITPLKRMQDNLLSLKEKAEHANQSKSEFLANMSHEIRTPMNAVIALTDMVLKMEMGNKQREYLKKVQASSRSLLQILNDILDYSKLEAGKFDIINEPFDLYKMLSNSLHLFSTTATQKGLSIDCDVDFEVPRFVKGDATRIAQIINNLLGNAIKFTEQGNISLKVSAKKSAISGAFQIDFGIADTGIGIEKTKLQSLFQSFSQADSSIERRFGGTGLGLAISRHLATLLNGSINVTSEPGKGSLFTLSIPLMQDKSLESALQDKLTDKSILIVGQENAHTALMHQLFGSLHARVEVDQNPHRLDNDDYWDIVIVDTTILSDTDRTRLVEHLLSSTGVNIREGIIFLSSEGYYHEHASEIILNTASAWLLTPFILSDLEDCIVNIFDRKKTLFSHAGGNEQLRFTDASVLLVEDHPTNQFVAIELLNAVGLNVVVAEDGYEAVRTFQKQPFDLVLMDLQMPNMDGFTAAQKIRALPVGKTVPIYAMSAAVMDADREKVTSVGMDGHIAKPVVREDLYSLLSKVLARKVLPTNSPAAAAEEKEPIDDRALRRALATTLISFDLDVAIGRLGNDAHTYLSLLENFHLHFADFASEIANAEDDETLGRRLHTMKGMSMSVGAVRLETLVKEAEHLLLAGRLDTTRELEQEFRVVHRSIEKALSVCRPLLKRELEGEKESLAELVEQVQKHQYLRLSDVEPYRSLLESTYGKDEGEQIISAITNLDYKKAIELMATVADQ